MQVLLNSPTRRGCSQIQLDLSNIQGKKAVLMVRVPQTGNKAVLGLERKSSLFRINLRVCTALVQEAFTWNENFIIQSNEVKRFISILPENQTKSIKHSLFLWFRKRYPARQDRQRFLLRSFPREWTSNINPHSSFSSRIEQKENFARVLFGAQNKEAKVSVIKLNFNLVL